MVSNWGENLRETMEYMQKGEWACEHKEGNDLEQINTV